MFVKNLRRNTRLIGSISALLLFKSTNISLNSNDKIKSNDYDIVIIGAGVVGLAVAQSCAIQTNASILVVDKEDVVAAGVSARNSGLGCTGYDAPVGSLERNLLRRSIRRHQNLYRSFGLSSNHVRKCGSLVVAWNENELAKLPSILEENREAGDIDAVLLNQEELRQLEPNLSHQALGAVYCPYESVVEPWLVPMGYAESARLNGVDFQLGTEISDIQYDSKRNHWKLKARLSDGITIARSLSGEMVIPSDRPKPKKSEIQTNITAKVIINCAGLFGDEVESMIRKSCSTENLIRSQGSFKPTSSFLNTSSEFKITPRKGQFLVYKLPSSPDSFMTIEPVATQFTKGVIVWQTLYGNVIVGPTADDVLDKDNYQTDVNVLKKLQDHAEMVYPLLKNAEIIGSYSGLRPASEFRDYQIYSNNSNGKKWITVGGIRSTGLTASSGIGEFVAELYTELQNPLNHQGKSITNDLSQDDIAPDGLLGVSISASSPLPLTEIYSKSKQVIPCAPVPPLHILAKEFQDNVKLSNKNPAEGYVTLYGKQCRVTHPIASFGMETYSGPNLVGTSNSDRRKNT